LQGILEVVAEFFDAIGSQKAHWYQVFDPSNVDENYLLIKSIFPPLASLMKIESDFIREVLLDAGLMKKKLHRGAYIVYAGCSAWDSLSNNIALRWKQLFFLSKIKKVFITKLVNGQILGILHGHQVTFGKKHQKQGSTMYQSFESLLQLSNWLEILVSSLLLSLFFFQDNKKCKKMKIVLVEKV
jgi:hypothetical protein